jgi:hypothetical protein
VVEVLGEPVVDGLSYTGTNWQVRVLRGKVGPAAVRNQYTISVSYLNAVSRKGKSRVIEYHSHAHLKRKVN